MDAVPLVAGGNVSVGGGFVVGYVVCAVVACVSGVAAGLTVGCVSGVYGVSFVGEVVAGRDFVFVQVFAGGVSLVGVCFCGCWPLVTVGGGLRFYGN